MATSLTGDERIPLLSATPVESLARLKDNGDTGRNARLNLLFLKRFWRIMRVIFPRLCSSSLVFFVLFIFCRAATEYNYYSAGLIPSHFYSALDSRSVSDFKEALWKATLIVFYVCICKSAAQMFSGVLYVKWRLLITQSLHKSYFSGINYYVLNIFQHKIDNIDQRITQDVDRWCKELTDQVLMKIILSPFIIAYYTYRTYQSVGYLGPLAIYGTFLVSTLINKFLMGPIVSLIVSQERQEGNFRFHHVQVRSSAESLAFYRAGQIEGNKADRLLQVLVDVQRHVVHKQFLLNFSVNVFDYVSSIVSYSLIGIAIFSGKYDSLSTSDLSVVISQNAFISMYLLNNFSTLVDTATNFSDIAGYTHRIGELMEALAKDAGGGGQEKSEGRGSGEPQRVVPEEFNQVHHVNEGSRYPVGPECLQVAAVFKDLSVAPPLQSDPLLEGLNLEFRKDNNVLILGDSGCGKSSLFRVLRGLWPPLRGRAHLCSDDNHHHVMFLPQRPYLTTGSLADQVAFPEVPKRNLVTSMSYQGVGINEDRITEALQMAGLVSLRDRLGSDRVDVNENWYDVVSPGEMQKIAFARIFFHKPPFVFLDEATCALSEETEHQFYTSLKLMGVTVMSVGHRSSIRKYHQQVLVIHGDRRWILTSCEV